MPLSPKTELLFAVPRTELYSRIVSLIANAQSVSFVVGFLTEEGISLIEEALMANPPVLASLVVGASTFKACDGLDRLRNVGVAPDRLRVHLGHTRRTSKRGFTRYHPMMHSKVYLFEGAQQCTAIVGSHNLTGFAIGGQNTEASVLIEAAPNDPLIQQVRDHIATVQAESQEYDPAMRLAYAWWFRQGFEGVQYKILYGDGEEDIERERTVLAIGIRSGDEIPQPGDIIYLEVPGVFRRLKALDEPVHFYVLDKLPGSVESALGVLPTCTDAFEGEVIGTNRGVVHDGDAHWIIRDIRNPILERTGGRVLPRPSAGNIQAFIRIRGNLLDRYKYIFEAPQAWEPIYDESVKGTAIAPPELRTKFQALDLIPAEHLPWYRVVGLQGKSDGRSFLEQEVSPSSGRFVLFARARIPLAPVGGTESPQQPDSPVDDVPGEVWFEVAKWAKETQQLENWQRSLAYSLGKLADAGAPPSEKQEVQGSRLLLLAVSLGFAHPRLTSRLLDNLRNKST